MLPPQTPSDPNTEEIPAAGSIHSVTSLINPFSHPTLDVTGLTHSFSKLTQVTTHLIGCICSRHSTCFLHVQTLFSSLLFSCLVFLFSSLVSAFFIPQSPIAPPIPVTISAPSQMYHIAPAISTVTRCVCRTPHSPSVSLSLSHTHVRTRTHTHTHTHTHGQSLCSGVPSGKYRWKGEVVLITQSRSLSRLLIHCL